MSGVEGGERSTPLSGPGPVRQLPPVRYRAVASPRATAEQKTSKRNTIWEIRPCRCCASGFPRHKSVVSRARGHRHRDREDATTREHRSLRHRDTDSQHERARRHEPLCEGPVSAHALRSPVRLFSRQVLRRAYHCNLSRALDERRC